MKALLTAVLSLSAAIAFAQAPDFGGKVQAEKMAALKFLEGRWEGEAWVYVGERKIPVSGYEEVRFLAGGTCAVINAEWKMKAGEREIPIHQPCAMIYWDASKKVHHMIAQLANGLRNDFDIEVKEKGFVWFLNHPQMGEVRYTMNLLPDGTWHEIGEHKTADGKWEPRMEMKLKKVK